jgi:FMN phosphatase YigB (HAD superfamily)
LAQRFVDRGYARLNRDEQGTSLGRLVPAIVGLVESGESRIVLDNTYVSRKSRAPVIHAAADRGLRTRCIWLATSVEDAQVNAVSRMLHNYERLLTPEDIRQLSKRDPNVFAPSVQFRLRRELEPPDESEGFSGVETVTFERHRNPSFTNRALILWCDAIVPPSAEAESTQRYPDLEQARAVLRRYEADGWHLCGLAWRPQIEANASTAEDVDAAFERMQEQLGIPIDVRYCPHPAGPPVCWCRKPLPGLGVLLIERYRLDPSRCVYVGSGPQDPGFARRLGFGYREVAEFFGRVP